MAGGVTTSVIAWVDTIALASVARTTKLKVPLCVGVPEICPFEIDMPVGSAPLCKAKA